MPFHELPPPPDHVTASTVLARLVDGLGFRYRWATEGLREEDLAFQPGPDCMPARKILEHIRGLVGWVDVCMGGEEEKGAADDDSGEALRESTLRRIEALSQRLKAMSDDRMKSCEVRHPRTGEQFPFWFLINGPLADALTHVGQINAWRRINGNPWPKANVFKGKPPEGR